MNRKLTTDSSFMRDRKESMLSSQNGLNDLATISMKSGIHTSNYSNENNQSKML